MTINDFLTALAAAASLNASAASDNAKAISDNALAINALVALVAGNGAPGNEVPAQAQTILDNLATAAAAQAQNTRDLAANTAAAVAAVGGVLPVAGSVTSVRVRGRAAGVDGPIRPATSTLPGPAITAPGNQTAPGPVLGSLTPTVTWETVPTAASTNLYVFQQVDNVHELIAAFKNLPGTSFTIPSGVLQSGQKYRVFADSVDANGGESMGGRGSLFVAP